MKPDELRFLGAVDLAIRNGETPRDVVNDGKIGIPYKRCWWFLTKWSRRGVYEYGTTIDLGWWTPAGIAWVKSVMECNGKSTQESKEKHT